ncbi:MAG: DNA polymerase III subunit beta [Verrucomicrobiota bacterium]
MKFTAPCSDLTDALNRVRSAASGGSLPILGNVALAVADGHLELTCTDLDLCLRTRLPVAVSKAGDCTVHAGLFFNIVNSLSSDEVEVSHVNNLLTLQAGNSTYKLGTLPLADFPPLPALKNPVAFELPQLTLRSLLASTGFCQSTDDARFVLCSTCLSLTPSLITAVATDGRRLAVEESPLAQSATLSLLLPPKTTKELLRNLATEEKDTEKLPPVSVTCTDNSARFEFGKLTLITKLIAGAYPNYRQVVPQDAAAPIHVGRSDLLKALKRVNLIADDSCTLEFSGQMLTVSAKGSKVCPKEAVETILIPRTTPITIKFNPSYLIEALGAVADDEVILHLAAPLSPIVIKVASKAWLCVIMPLRADAVVKPEPEVEAAAQAPVAPSPNAKPAVAPEPVGV